MFNVIPLLLWSSISASQVQLLSKDFGKHLLEVDDLLQKHNLQEADITVQAERVETLNNAALKFTAIEGRYTFRQCLEVFQMKPGNDFGLIS